jgi:hypothetical protein
LEGCNDIHRTLVHLATPASQQHHATELRKGVQNIYLCVFNSFYLLFKLKKRETYKRPGIPKSAENELKVTSSGEEICAHHAPVNLDIP